MADQTPDGGLAALDSRYGLPPGAAARLGALVELLADEPLAPTAIRDRRRVIEDHIADALVALELEEVRAARSIADLGSGAGLPGLPLAIALPEGHVTLLESNGRKCSFIEVARRRCDVDNAEVVCSRVEEWREGRGQLELVTARALAPLPVVAEYGAPLLRVGGVLVVWRGRRDREEESQAAVAARELGLEYREPIPVTPYDGAAHRHLQLMPKVRDTPDRFPRRPGVAVKRPLGAVGAR